MIIDTWSRVAWLIFALTDQLVDPVYAPRPGWGPPR